MHIYKKITQTTRKILSIRERGFRYVVVGIFNTIFGWVIGPIIYYGLQERINVLIVGMISYVASITVAFLTHKIFVFKTKGSWISEYLRSYVVYGSTAVIGIGALWFLVDGFSFPFWLAQAIIIIMTVIVSYFGHSKYTFNR